MKKIPMIAVESISKRFGDITAVDGLSFEVHPGEILGFLGPNGAGKSTCVGMLAGLLAPDGGTISINGQALKKGKDPLRRCIGLSPQEIVVWQALTCLEQLNFMGAVYGATRKQAAKSAKRLLNDLGLWDKRHRLASTLSGGMQRRLNIALALIHEPDILILDEPQAGLDPQSRILVRDYILGLKGKTTVIITTHDMEEAEKLSDRVCIIDHGKRLVLDTVPNVKAMSNGMDHCQLQVAEKDASHLKALLEELLPGRAEWTIRNEIVTFSDTTQGALLTEVIQFLNANALHPTLFGMRQTTLEDVFINMTGRGLRE